MEFLKYSLIHGALSTGELAQMLLGINKLFCPHFKVENLPRVTGNEHLGESNHVSTVASGVLDEADGLVDSTLEVLPDGFGLDSGNLDRLGHFSVM